MRFRDLRTGDRFQFSIAQTVTYEYHVNGWYGLPSCDGSWHRHDNPAVILVSRPITTLEKHYAQYLTCES
jgi:hypothetical protein